MALTYLKYGLTQEEAKTGIRIAKALKEHNRLSIEAHYARSRGDMEKLSLLEIHMRAQRAGLKVATENITYSIAPIASWDHGLEIEEIEAALETARLLKKHREVCDMERDSYIEEEKKNLQRVAAQFGAEAEAIIRKRFSNYVSLRA